MVRFGYEDLNLAVVDGEGMIAMRKRKGERKVKGVKYPIHPSWDHVI